MVKLFQFIIHNLFQNATALLYQLCYLMLCFLKTLSWHFTRLHTVKCKHNINRSTMENYTIIFHCIIWHLQAVMILVHCCCCFYFPHCQKCVLDINTILILLVLVWANWKLKWLICFAFEINISHHARDTLLFSIIFICNTV